VLICRVDDPTSATITELAAFDLPQADVAIFQPATALDDLERTTHTTGYAILRRLFQAQSEQIDAQLTQQQRLSFSACRGPR
jgi:hypothetical protein